FTDALPKTRSGKIMRRLLRDIAAGKETLGDTTTLEDYTVLARLREDEDRSSSPTRSRAGRRSSGPASPATSASTGAASRCTHARASAPRARWSSPTSSCATG